MAISLGTVINASGFGPVGALDTTHTIGGHELQLGRCIVQVNLNDQSNAYAQADGCTFDPRTMIGTMRNGHTITVLAACPVEAGLDNGVKCFAGACTVAASVVHFHAMVEDCTTEKGNGAWAAAATWTKNVAFCVTYGEQMD